MNGNGNKPLRVAIYCRLASEDQISKNALIQEYTSLVRSHENWTLTSIYMDIGVPASPLSKRIQLNRLLADCRKGKIDKILVKSISRLARDLIFFQQVIYRDLVFFELPGEVLHLRKPLFQHGKGFLFLLSGVQRGNTVQRGFNRPRLFGEIDRLLEKPGGDKPSAMTHPFKKQKADNQKLPAIVGTEAGGATAARSVLYFCSQYSTN